MPVRKHLSKDLFALFCLVVLGAQLSTAASNQPTTWWPDPSTGLMWTGQASSNGHPMLMNWDEANEYCATLRLGDYTSWRLPTPNELSAIIYIQHVVPKTSFFNPSYNNPPYDIQVVKGGIKTVRIAVPGGTGSEIVGYIHTSVRPNSYLGIGSPQALCTRPMEADLIQVANDAQVSKPVPNLQTLKNYALLSKARMAFQAGKYQESINQAKNALLVKPDFAPAYWAIGISYGMSGQWDLAITNLEIALKIDKDYGDAKDSLKWAKDGQKAAKTGGRIKEPLIKSQMRVDCV